MKKEIAIALQGGGSHGAFSWGILDQLLEEPSIKIKAISGTSAGGMNAACVIQGLIEGGEKRAQEKLREYWHSVAKLSSQIVGSTCGVFNLDELPAYHIAKLMQNFFSPYDTNPLNVNPFYDFLDDFFDYKLLNKNKEYKLFLSATNVKNGKIKIFKNEDCSPKTLMATACLPQMFHAVEIDGEHYWDGGFIANPAIYPLIDECKNIFFIQLRRTYCDKLPKTQTEIEDRLKEITFNGCVLREIRSIYFITHLIDKGYLKDEANMERVNFYLLKNEAAFDGLNMSSAINSSLDFILYLYGKGKETAQKWLETNRSHIGEKTTFDPFKDFV